MRDPEKSFEKLLSSLQERAKELACLYAVEEILNDADQDPMDAAGRIVAVIPPGWQYPDICIARIVLGEKEVTTPGFAETPWCQSAVVRLQEREVGSIHVYYTEEMPDEDEGPFLKEESRLIRTIADRLGHFLYHQWMKAHFREWKAVQEEGRSEKREDWRIILDLVSHTDKNLYTKICHMMLNHLSWSGVKEAEALLEQSELYRKRDERLFAESNQPYEKRKYEFPVELGRQTFDIAATQMSDEGILFRIQKWMQEDRLGFLVRAVERNLSLAEVADAIRRYHHITTTETDLSRPVRKVVRVSLIRRFLSDQLPYIKIAKEYIGIRDFHELLQYIVYTRESHGRLGGKAAGFYLAARILEEEKEKVPELGSVKIPKTWHITSDMQLHFMHYNNLDEIVEQKYKDLGQIRFEYPHIVHTCKNSRSPPELIQGLAVALDDLGDVPLIVRSSSVLEDRVGAAFSGKYKSLFVANQGTKAERLEALVDAVAEVYASMFGPDPIGYRAERGLLDFGEEMGIVIQEVVGTRVGPYYLPAFAGVAFSRNEFRWSPRIRREDGLIRLVPGLGTRAVDRVSDDFPILFAPGQPGLRVNASPDEVLRYSPRYLDVINLETRSFETLSVADLVSRHGAEFPGLGKVFAIHEHGHFRRPSLADTNIPADQVVATFEGLIGDATFVRQMRTMLDLLAEKIEHPVDIEFAHDGKDLYLLQCRTQSYAETSGPAPIPKDIPADKLVFSANKHISNGKVPPITHIVYVDPDRYADLPDRESLVAVGRAVSRLNSLLPKRQFVLMGPGRWGSRGDIKLGVPVTYTDINNTSVLIEIARRKGNYTPDLSFGTHFFQDLVEARIHYLPLYPDESGIAFNEAFLRRSANLLPELLPELAHLKDTVRVIDVPAVTGGLVLRILLNAEIDQAVGVLAHPGKEPVGQRQLAELVEEFAPDHSRWRLAMVDQIAERTDLLTYGIRGIYVLGSTKNFTAGPESDIDLLIHVDGTAEQRELLDAWLSGWSQCLDEVNFQRVGTRVGGLLDVHYVTDEDIENKTSWAVKIGAVTDAARPVKLAD